MVYICLLVLDYEKFRAPTYSQLLQSARRRLQPGRFDFIC